jgi:hypothetical protein
LIHLIVYPALYLTKITTKGTHQYPKTAIPQDAKMTFIQLWGKQPRATMRRASEDLQDSGARKQADGHRANIKRAQSRVLHDRDLRSKFVQL